MGCMQCSTTNSLLPCSYGNVPARAEVYTSGTTHVAVGFLDLGNLQVCGCSSDVMCTNMLWPHLIVYTHVSMLFSMSRHS